MVLFRKWTYGPELVRLHAKASDIYSWKVAFLFWTLTRFYIVVKAPALSLHRSASNWISLSLFWKECPKIPLLFAMFVLVLELFFRFGEFYPLRIKNLWVQGILFLHLECAMLKITEISYRKYNIHISAPHSILFESKSHRNLLFDTSKDPWHETYWETMRKC